MKLIIGLGNPGEKFEKNRHNVGFMVVDALASKILNSKFQLQKKYKSEILKTGSLILAKPQTFMNESGNAVRKLVAQYKIKKPDLWVIYDDLDLVLGDYKIQKGRSPKVHNGVNSIYEQLGNKDFWHVRIGIDNRDKNNKLPGETYVLQNFNKDELETIRQVIENLVAELVKY